MNNRLQYVSDVHARVPAYREFLKKQNTVPSAPWADLPLMNKANYLLDYSTENLCWDGSISGCHLIGASSGFSKSGSIFWPKRPCDEAEYMASLENLMIDYYGIDKRKTLIFVCLAFGTWIGGIQIASAMRVLAASGRHPLTVATPSLNLSESVEIYARYGSNYEQAIWILNPSSVNLIAALLDRRGIQAPPGTIFFPVVGEYFTEHFREAIARRFGHPEDHPFVVWTGYGSADAGDLGAETAATIALRKFFHRHPALSQEFFGTDSTPMLLAIPAGCFLEIVNGNIVVTKDQMVPLVRYDTGDSGGLLSRQKCLELPYLPSGLPEKLPEQILFVHGRASDAVIFYGTNLLIGAINGHFFSLPERYRYGGLFELRRVEKSGVTIFSFRIFVRGELAVELCAHYQESLIGFLKRNSLEFNAKYDALSQSAGEPLIRVELRDIAEVPGKAKHRYIVED